MTSPVKLIAVREISDVPVHYQFTWLYHTKDRWIPFPAEVSSTIEEAFRRGADEIFIVQHHRIDFKYFLQEHVVDRHTFRQPIHRQCTFEPVIFSDRINTYDRQRCERFLFPLGSVSNCSTCTDTKYYGSPFIEEWFLWFTEGKLTISFDDIFPALLYGLQEEGKVEPEHILHSIVDDLHKIRDAAVRQTEKKKMEELENYCAALYTKPYFVYRTVNTALRDNDSKKLSTLGPYCFLFNNYIGRHANGDASMRHRFQQALHPTEPKTGKLFRGDYITPEMIDEYRQAAGNKTQYFKWLPFVSTSCDPTIAEIFARNVLYFIDMPRHSSNDLYADMSAISCFKAEKEIILQPGVRFRVVTVGWDLSRSLHAVHIHIVPSYISCLK